MSMYTSFYQIIPMLFFFLVISYTCLIVSHIFLTMVLYSIRMMYIVSICVLQSLKFSFEEDWTLQILNLILQQK